MEVLDRRPFIILSSRRAGSHMLASALDSHPNLLCVDYEPFIDIKKGMDRIYYLQQFDCGGYLVKYEQIDLADAATRDALARYDIIHLMRGDLVATALSDYILTRKKRTGAEATYRNEAPVTQVTFNDGDCSRVAALVNKFRSGIQTNTEYLQGLRVFDVEYEKLTDGGKSVDTIPQPIADDMCEFLDVDAKPLSIEYIKNINAQPCNVITNYDKVMAYMEINM